MDTNLLLDGKLWKEYGIVMQRGQGDELFIFDPEKGLLMSDNIAYFWTENSMGNLASKSGVTVFELSDLLNQIDKVIFDYFFN